MAASIVKCVRLVRHNFVLSRRKFLHSLAKHPRQIFGGNVLLAAALTKVSLEDTKSKLEEPDPSKLSREYLIKSACISTVEQAGILLVQTALALKQAEKEYVEALFALVILMEYKLKVLGNETEEARIWDHILAGRDLVNKLKAKKHNLEMILTSAQGMLNTAAEVSYVTGADLAGSCAADRLLKVELFLKEAQRETEEAEMKLRAVEVKTVTVEGKYAEELAKKKAQAAEEDEDVQENQPTDDSGRTVTNDSSNSTKEPLQNEANT